MRLNYDTARQVLSGTTHESRLHPCDDVHLKIVNAVVSAGFLADAARRQVIVAREDSRVTIYLHPDNTRLTRLRGPDAAA